MTSAVATNFFQISPPRPVFRSSVIERLFEPLVRKDGPMRILEIHERVPDCGLLGFCEVVGRDPFSLVGRKQAPNFKLTDLAALKLASVSEVPTPWLCLQDDIRRAGLDPTRLDRVTDRSMANNVAALAAGEVDVVQLFEPYVTQAVAAGGPVWLARAAPRPAAYTAL